MISRQLFNLTFPGQIPNGKNAMRVVPLTGRHYPEKKFKAWRTECFAENWEVGGLGYTGPVELKIRYWWKDKRKRDKDNLESALFNVLVNGGWLADDNCEVITNTRWEYMGLDRKNPRCEVSAWTVEEV